MKRLGSTIHCELNNIGHVVVLSFISIVISSVLF